MKEEKIGLETMKDLLMDQVEEERAVLAGLELKQRRADRVSNDRRASSKKKQSSRQELQELKTELPAQREKLAHLSRQLNDYNPLSRLSFEILAGVSLKYVFEEAPAATRDATGHYSPKRCRAWIRIAHICHHWRTAAIRSPTIWSTLKLVSDTKYVTDMLARSQSAPLDIRDSPRCTTEAYQAAFKHMCRMRCLDIAAGAFNPLEVALSGSAPLLQSLTLRHYNVQERRSVPVEDLLVALEACALPSLQHVGIYDCGAPWQSALLRHTLTELVVSDAHGDATAEPLADVVDAIAALPSLEYLDLSNTLPRNSNLTPAQLSKRPPKTASLPRLRCIHLSDDALACGLLLRHFIFPAAATIKLRCTGRASGVEVICRSIAAHFSQPSADDNISLLTASFAGEIPPERDDYEHHSTRLRCWHSFLPADALDDGPPKALLDIQLKISPSDVLFRTMLTNLPLLGVQSLSLVPNIGSVDNDLSSSMWIKTVAPLTNLRQLYTTRWGISDEYIVTSLSAKKRAPLEGGRGQNHPSAESAQLFLPRLEALYLSDILWRDGSENTMTVQLYNALRIRKQAGCELGLLAFRECYNFGGEDAKVFRDVVRKVDWDRELAPMADWSDLFEYSLEHEPFYGDLKHESGYEHPETDRDAEEDTWDVAEDLDKEIGHLFHKWDHNSPGYCGGNSDEDGDDLEVKQEYASDVKLEECGA